MHLINRWIYKIPIFLQNQILQITLPQIFTGMFYISKITLYERNLKYVLPNTNVIFQKQKSFITKPSVDRTSSNKQTLK